MHSHKFMYKIITNKFIHFIINNMIIMFYQYKIEIYCVLLFDVYICLYVVVFGKQKPLINYRINIFRNNIWIFNNDDDEWIRQQTREAREMRSSLNIEQEDWLKCIEKGGATTFNIQKKNGLSPPKEKWNSLIVVSCV